MKKKTGRNMRIIQINGIRGLLITLFIASCLIAGFIAFPSFLAMNIWNFFSESTSAFPAITFVQGLLLWSIIAFSFYIFNKRKFIVSFNSQPELTEPEINEMMAKIKTQVIKKQILKYKDLKSEEIKEELKELEDKKS